LSAVIIAQDEAKRIEPCMRALAGWADEIVVVDSGSSDRTVEICRNYTPRVIESHWRGYAKQKQFAVDSALHEWVLSVDADEVVTPQLRDEIDRVLSADPDEVAFHVPREYVVFGKTLRHGDCGRAPIRLFRRTHARFSDHEVHESMVVDGPRGRLRSRLTHYWFDDWGYAVEKHREYATLWAAQEYRRGRRVNFLQCYLHAMAPFLCVWILRRGFLDGRLGFLLATLQSQYAFNKYVNLWRMGQGVQAPLDSSAPTPKRERERVAP
jgi:glycosyltransferase involved in cell wall biosynthesis